MPSRRGSIAEVTNQSGGHITQQTYYAGACPELVEWGQKRGGGTLPTENHFTGQKLDETGLMYYRARYYDPQIGIFISPDTIMPEPTKLLSYNRYMYGYGNPLRNVDPSGHANVDTAGFTAGYVETIAPLLNHATVFPHDVLDVADNWIGRHSDYNPSADPNLSAGQARMVHAAYTIYYQGIGDDARGIAHNSATQGVNNPDIQAELSADVLDNGFSNISGGSPILFGSVRTGRGKNKLQPDPDATGPHTIFKRDPDTGEITGYETYQVSDPRNPNPWISEKRVDLRGASHYDKKTKQYIDTPHVHESNGTTRPARLDEMPR